MGRRIFVVLELEILMPGKDIDFWIGQPGVANTEEPNKLVELIEPSDSHASNIEDCQQNPKDSIHFREFEGLDLFRS